MPRVVSISEFKAKCLALVGQVKKSGEPLLITKRGKPIAQVIPPPEPPKLETWLGCMRGSAKIVGDIMSPVLEESDWEVLKD